MGNHVQAIVAARTVSRSGRNARWTLCADALRIFTGASLMRLSRFHYLCRAVLAALTPVVGTCAGLGQAALDLNGGTVDVFARDSGKVAVLIFLRRDCPVSSRYAPVIQ